VRSSPGRPCTGPMGGVAAFCGRGMLPIQQFAGTGQEPCPERNRFARTIARGQMAESLRIRSDQPSMEHATQQDVPGSPAGTKGPLGRVGHRR
jgi:hypothetical protein